MAANRIQLQNALHKPYDRVLFSREVLSPVFGSGFTLNSSLVPASVSPNKSESDAIANVWIYGKIQLDDSTEITCYEVLLQPKVRIEQSKIAIQQYVRKLLTAGQAALINFVAPANTNVWRLTLVAKDSVLTEKGVKEKTTHAKRYTFLLGPSETCKTAAERFETLSTEKEITFQTLVNAFSVEKLSKEFFNEYTLHYQNFCNYLQESNYRKSVFNITFPEGATKQEKDKASKPIRDFVKKLLGRIVFLYFVQKKGWLGASNTQYTDGMTDFIKQLFLQSGGNDAFYSNWLTVLFFDTLNKERPNDDFKMPDGKTVKVPYLNGGLFDKEEFDEQLLTFPAKLFHNPDFEDFPLTEKNKNNARGFLDFLDAFNFTVYEDSPDDHTVAVDPEMLGHIFENLLEDNKDKGAFYTPKEIVHYMCQESLSEYLCNTLQINSEVAKREAINQLLKNKVVDNILKPEIAEVEKALDRVKICDPAIGSGAFPMGLLQEIFSIKELIAYETGKQWNPAETKLNIIQNSIYGVDIEKGAVDIARLRFWLSLVVDEEKPKPLPNLDYKIVVGDSLISKFDDEIVEIDWECKQSVGKADEYVKNVQRLLVEVADKQKNYFSPNNTNKKKLQAEIRNLKIELLINQLSYNKLAYIEKTPQKGGFMPTAADIKHNTERELQIAGFDKLISKLKQLLQHPDEHFNHFDWKLDFPEVLNPYLIPDNNKRGFDIVIGNPPYIKEYTRKEAFNGLRNSPYYQGKMDLWHFFACKGIDLLKEKGLLTFIAQNNWVTNKGASKMRNKVIEDTKIIQLIDFGPYFIFENASIQTMIMLFQKDNVTDNYKIDFRRIKIVNNKENILKTILNKEDSEYIEYITPLIKRKEYKDKTLTFARSDIEAILLKIKSKGTENIHKNEISQGIVIPQDFLNENNAKKLNNKYPISSGIFVLSKEEKDKLNLTQKENEIIRPFFTTEELHKYYGNPNNKLWIIYSKSDMNKNISNYPNIKRHLDIFKEIITSDFRPYGLHRARDEAFFIGEKIISLRKCVSPFFTYTDFDCYVSQTFFIIKTKRINMKYLTGVLNSKVIAFWLWHKGKRQGNNFQIDAEPLLNIPLPPITQANQSIITQIEALVDKILSAKKSNPQTDTSQWEKEIDKLVYSLYELTEEEIKIIEGE